MSKKMMVPAVLKSEDQAINIDESPFNIGSFKDFPPMLIQVGSNEMLLSDSETVAAKAREEGVKVRLHVYEGMFHVFQMAYLNIPESKKAWAEVGKFMDVLWSDARL